MCARTGGFDEMDLQHNLTRPGLSPPMKQHEKCVRLAVISVVDGW